MLCGNKYIYAVAITIIPLQTIDDYKENVTVWFVLKKLCPESANNASARAAWNSLLLEENPTDNFTSLPN